MDDPATTHRRVASAFTATVEGLEPAGWDRPAPPERWVARDVVGHLVAWFPLGQAMDAALRASGHYGQRVAVPDGADVQTKLLAFIGRHP